MSRSSWLAAAWVVALANAGCVEFALRETMRPTVYELPPPAPPADPTPGAIWVGGTSAGSFLYYDRKARGLGDLVTVRIQENLAAQGSANTALEKSSAMAANASSDLGFVDALQDASGKLFDLLGFGRDRVTAAPGASHSRQAARCSAKARLPMPAGPVSKRAWAPLATLRFSVSKDGLEISASSPEYGEAKEIIEKDFKGDPISIGFNAQYLSDFLAAAAEGPISLELKDDQSAGQMRPLADDKYRYRYVIMPMRI